MKKGVEFIADPNHRITEENLHQLYEMTVGDFLAEEDRLLPGNYYRHDSVYVVGDKVEHMGLPWKMCIRDRVQQPRHPAISIKVRMQVSDIEVKQRRFQQIIV